MSLAILKSSEDKRSLSIAVSALLLLTINFALHFPGQMTRDSLYQYQQAVSGQFTDVHPPIMAVLWSMLRHVASGPPTMLAFHLIVHWLGFALIADGLLRTGRSKAGWLMLATGASPIFIYWNGLIIKDVGMASTFIAGFGLVFWYRIQGRQPAPAAIIAALAFIAYGTLVRANAVFAFAPLLLYAAANLARISAARLVVFSCLLSAAALPVSTRINRDLIGAAPSFGLQSLQLFDLAGIVYFTGDLSILPPAAHLSVSELNRCYTPIEWDTLGPWGQCNFVFKRLGLANYSNIPSLTRTWVDGIVSHPFAYAQHRLKHFNSEIYFFVPARSELFSPNRELVKHKDSETTARDIQQDYIERNAWPVGWIILGVCMTVLLRRFPTSEQRSASWVLLVSGLGYALAYVIIGISVDFRYHYWSIMAVQTSLILAFPLLADRIRTWDRTVIVCALLLIVTVSAGLFARLTDNQSLLF